MIVKLYIINLMIMFLLFGGDLFNVKDIIEQSVLKWFRDFILKWEYVEQLIVCDYIFIFRILFWELFDVVKFFDWQEQKEWINIKINFEKLVDWIDDLNLNGSIFYWNIFYIFFDWFKKNNEKLIIEFYFELIIFSLKMVCWILKLEGVDRIIYVLEYFVKK